MRVASFCSRCFLSVRGAKIAVDGAALPQTFSKPQFWYTNTCADALRLGIPTEAKQAADPRCPSVKLMLRLLNPPPNHLTVCLDHGAPLCSLPHIDVNDVNTIANDPRVLSAGVSQEEARTYVRGVNDQVAKGVGKTHLLIPGSIGCAILSFVFSWYSSRG